MKPLHDLDSTLLRTGRRWLITSCADAPGAPRSSPRRRDDRRRRWTSSGLDRHDAVWAQAHDDPDHVNHHQGAGHV
jgi:hypothetical protein